MFYLVYKITNVVNGKHYIGAHKTNDKNDGYMGSGVMIKNAIKKYGIENFIKEIMCECSSQEEMFAKEKELVRLDSTSYNLKYGGEGGWDYVNREKLNIILDSCRAGGKLGGKSAYESKVGIHSPDFIRPPQKKLVEDCDMINAYKSSKNISEALLSLGLARTGGSRRRMQRLIASLDQLE